MKRLSFESKPFTVPSDNPTAEALIRCYWQDISRCPLLLANMRRPDGTLYLAKAGQGMTTNSNAYTHTNQPENERSA